MSRSARFPRWRGLAAAALAVWLAGCGGGGGGGDDDPPLAGTCSVTSQKRWLSDYMNEWYLWSTWVQPQPVPADASLDTYFRSLLYTGGVAGVPADRWSGSQPTQSYNLYYGEGQTMGYGLAVAGIEVAGRQDDPPLYVRLVEPKSDAGLQGIKRGERVLALNGLPVGPLIAANDFSLLSPAEEGQALRVTLRNAAGADRTVTLTAKVFTLTPVPTALTLATPGGRKIGYVVLNQMISQAQPQLEMAFAGFKAQGLQDLVLDLRYNGGGLVSVAALVGSLVGGSRTAGQTFATLAYNDKRAATNNQTFPFNNNTWALGLPRVYVLAGSRTCSASEQVVNALQPFLDVVLVGGTTCGKPVGFLPADNGCGTTYSVVNFESRNALGRGAYYDGFNPTCPAEDGWTQPLGSVSERLLATAMGHADSGRCPAAAGAPVKPLASRPGRLLGIEPGERQDMIGR